MLRLRLRGPSGNTVTGSFDPTQPLGEFLQASAARFGETELELLLGFPPALCTAEQGVALGTLVASGASVTFRRLESAAAAATPPPPPLSQSAEAVVAAVGAAKTTTNPTTTTITSAWACEVCTLENAASSNSCAACETPRASNNFAGGSGGGVASGSGGGYGVAFVEKMRDDNSCLFHGIAWALDPSTQPTAMRQCIAAAVRADPSR